MIYISDDDETIQQDQAASTATASESQNTYKRSKLCLIEEHWRKIIHHGILVVNYESSAIC